MSKVKVLRRKSAWVNDEALSLVASVWGKALRPFKDTHQPILLLDACSAHMGQHFLRALTRWNIWVVFIPARTTWLLQPCDTHCFAAFKGALHKMFEQSLLDNEDGAVDIKIVILHLNRAIRQVVQGKEWSSAFDGNGWSSQQKWVREKILLMLECSTLPKVSDALPSLQQFQAIFPRRRFIPLALLLNHYCVRPGGGEPIAPPPPPHPDLGVQLIATRGPWHGCLRSSSRLDLPPPEAVLLEHLVERELTPPPLPPPCLPPEMEQVERRPRHPQRQQPGRAMLPVGRPLLLHRGRSRAAVDRSPSSQRQAEARPSKLPRTSTT